jgi:hypothetical protein
MPVLMIKAADASQIERIENSLLRLKNIGSRTGGDRDMGKIPLHPKKF